MHILVTGGLGFIGSNFIKYMFSKNKDIKITNVDKMGLGSNPANLLEVSKLTNYQFIKGDISNMETSRSLVREVDAVVNIAAETHVDRSIADPKTFVESNFLGAFSLLEAIRKNNSDTNFVQVSTDEVYGDILKGSFIELDRVNPSNPYSATKASAEMLCLAYHRTYHLAIKITRCSNNFGPYQFPEKLIPKTIIRAHNKLQIPIYGTGTNIRDWIYVQDHCEAISKVLFNGKPGEIYNISSSEELPNIEVVTRILEVLNRKKDLMTFVEDRPGHDVRYSLDSSKIRSELLWKPRYTFKSALEKTVKWYIENDEWWKPISNEKVLQLTPWKEDSNS